jgi:hypothetical protein
MPWGEHKGTKLEDVPVNYKAWLLEQKHWITDWPGLASYLRKHQDTILKEADANMADEGEKEGYDNYEDYRRDVRG